MQSEERPARPQPRPGETARSPLEIPPRGWWRVLKRAVHESRVDNLPIIAGGVAFFAFVALFPGLLSALTLYGLFADPDQIAEQVERIATALPPSARELIVEQLTAISRADDAVTLGLVVSMLATLWTASIGTSNMIRAVNLSYDEGRRRGIVRLRATGLGLTLGAIVFVLLTLALIAVVPIVVDQVGLGGIRRTIVQVLRWVVLAGVILVSLTVLYRIAPAGRTPPVRWVLPGAIVAALLWFLGGLGLSLYVRWFGTYNETYGTLAGVIVLMLSLWLVSFAVLLGAEINAESERQPVSGADDETAQADDTDGANQGGAADTAAGAADAHEGSAQAENPPTEDAEPSASRESRGASES